MHGDAAYDEMFGFGGPNDMDTTLFGQAVFAGLTMPGAGDDYANSGTDLHLNEFDIDDVTMLYVESPAGSRLGVCDDFKGDDCTHTQMVET